MANNLQTACSAIEEKLKVLSGFLYGLGVRQLIFCVGNRSIPVINSLIASKLFRHQFWPEERSAAFYALGLCKRDAEPVAIITTSGTAAGELLPAIMEGYYSRLPLLAITTDRPYRFCGSGAPQAAEQKGLYGIYCPCVIDCDEQQLADGALSLISQNWQKREPAHLNLRLEDGVRQTIETAKEPLWQFVKQEESQEELVSFLDQSRYPLVVVGTLPKEQRDAVKFFLETLKAPCYLESTSGLREEPSLCSFNLLGQKVWQQTEKAYYPIDAVLRLGGVPTWGGWRDLEASRYATAVLSVSSSPFVGLSRSRCIVGDLKEILMNEKLLKAAKSSSPYLHTDHLLEKNNADRAVLNSLLQSYPLSEMAMVHWLSCLIPSEERLFLGNSMPIRQWDLAATLEKKHDDVWASRGLNGIDGQLSTFFGLCEPNKRSWGLFGDLTTLFDMIAPWVFQETTLQDSSILPICVVINNRGGKIFSRFWSDKRLQTEHNLHFAPLAEMWNMPYLCLKDIRQLSLGQLNGGMLLELQPDEKESEAIWQELDRL